jgi:hypothetical protein
MLLQQAGQIPPVNCSDVALVFSSFCFVSDALGIFASSTWRLDNDSVTEDFNLEANCFLLIITRAAAQVVL